MQQEKAVTVFISLVEIEEKLFFHLCDKQNEQSNSVILCF